MSDPLLLDLLKLAGRLQEILDQLESKKHPEVAAAVNQFVKDYSSDKSGPCALFGANCKETWKLERKFYGSHIFRVRELSGTLGNYRGSGKEALGAVCEESLRFVLDSKCPVDQQENSEHLRKALRRYLSLQGYAVDATPAPPQPGECDAELVGRGVAPRDDWFLKQYEASGTDTYHKPKRIQEKWWDMTEAERAAICPDSPGKVTLDTVKTGNKRAQKRRGSKPTQRTKRRRQKA